MEYNLFLLNNLSPKLYSKLKVIQNSGIRLSMGCRISTPIRVLLSESGIPSLNIRSKYLADNFALKLLMIEDHPLSNLLCELHYNTRSSSAKRQEIKNYHLLTSFLKLFHEIRQTIKKFTVQLPYPYKYNVVLTGSDINCDFESGIIIRNSQSSEDKFQEIFRNDLNNDQTHIFYTDGSKKNDGELVGLAIYSPPLNLSLQIKIDVLVSIFTAESYAILNAIKIIKENNIAVAMIFTDSLSVLEAISSDSQKYQNYIIYEIRKEIWQCNAIIKFVWIPSHLNIKGNENVDKLVKDAIRNGSFNNILLPYTDLKGKISRLMRERHFNYIDKIDVDKGVH